jgi:signal transduction histidine kinase
MFSATRASFWTGTLLSALVGSMLYLVTLRSIESDAQERFVSHAKHAQSVINVRIKSYSDLLRGTASLLQSSEPISHRVFHDYVRGLGLSKHFPAIDTFNFAIHVRDEQLPAFRNSLEHDLQHFLGPQAQLQIKPPGRRSDYLLVSYIEPDAARTEHYGIDLMANPYLMAQLAQARDSGAMHSSGRPISALSTPTDIHLGVRMPVYRSPAPATVEQRRAAYVGSLGIAFSVPKLLHGVMDEIPVTGVRIAVFDVGPTELIDRETKSGPKLVFDSRSRPDDPTPALDTEDEHFVVALPLNFSGRPWRATYSAPKAALYTEFDSSYPKMMMAFGFTGTALLYALLHTLTSSRRAALSLAREMTKELRESQHKLQLSHEKLRRLADHAYQIKELERKRIAREIHDDLGQSLLVLRIETEMLASRTKSMHSHLHKRACATLEQIDTTIKSVRQIINDLRPTVLDLGLTAAVEWQVAEFQRRTGIRCQIRNESEEIYLSDHCATAFFRILQESLTNIVRHAHASEVIVELHLNAGWLTLSVKDNGCGLPPGGRNKTGSFGLVGIEERIMILGGTCTIASDPTGTTVTVAAPLTAALDSAVKRAHELGAGTAVV